MIKKFLNKVFPVRKDYYVIKQETHYKTGLLQTLPMLTDVRDLKLLCDGYTVHLPTDISVCVSPYLPRIMWGWDEINVPICSTTIINEWDPYSEAVIYVSPACIESNIVPYLPGLLMSELCGLIYQYVYSGDDRPRSNAVLQNDRSAMMNGHKLELFKALQYTKHKLIKLGDNNVMYSEYLEEVNARLRQANEWIERE